ncbi:MAG: outer membrane lipoprotein carrier protein LolA [Desulfofustis sp.]|nr:outer membrane lipoprotein carrier protein LolA [Desulfofustis sp.]
MNTLLRRATCVVLPAAVMMLLIAPTLPCRAADDADAAKQVVQRMQLRYQQLSSLRFSFSQETSGQFTGRPKIGRGGGILVNTGQQTLMRWNYDSPEQQIIISDGRTVSMYFKDLNQMIIAPADTAQTDVLLSFFTGDRALDETFLILPPETAEEQTASTGSHQLSGAQLVPRQPHAQLSTVHLFIDNDSLIRRIDMVDHFDTRTIIDLDSIEVNPLDIQDTAAIEQVFTFTPPPGTEIIRQ